MRIQDIPEPRVMFEVGRRLQELSFGLRDGVGVGLDRADMLGAFEVDALFADAAVVTTQPFVFPKKEIL
ncbi:MAG: hypothetical protein ACE5K9_01015 [Candidatus Methylomirabilales bacterium]